MFALLGRPPKRDAGNRLRLPLPPSDPDRFWQVVDRTVGGTQDEQFDAHTKHLRSLSGKELIAFHADYMRMVVEAGRWDLWGAAYVINGGCGDEGFEYFRDWLISRGRAVFDAALADPESLADPVRRMPEGEHAEFEMYRYVPTRVFVKDLKLGEFPILDFSSLSTEITGKPFDEKTVFAQFPKLAEVARG